MKRFFAIALLIVILLVNSQPALAGGDKVRGERGQGDVWQHQTMNPPPFNP